MPTAPPARVAVLLVDEDEHPLSPEVLDAVLATSAAPELVVVEARTTPGRAWLDRPEVTVLRGLGRGTALRAQAFSATSAQIVAFLDARTVPDLDWIDAAVAAFEQDSTLAGLTGLVPGAGEPTLSFTGNVGAFHPAITDRVHQVLFPLPELAIFRRSVIDGAGGLDSRLSWPAAVIQLGWRATLTGATVRLDPAIRAQGSCSCRPDPYSGLAVLFTCLGDEALERTLPAATLVATTGGASTHDGAVDEFVAATASLAAQRDDVQERRSVPDTQILPMALAPLEPGRGEEDRAPAFASAIARYCLSDIFESRQRVLIVTPDILTARMAGPAIRAWQIAEALADRHVVTLASTASVCEVSSPRFLAAAPDDFGLRRLAADASVVILQGFAMEGRPYLKAEDKVVLVDLYDPLHLEQLELYRDEPEEKRRFLVREATRVLNEQLVRGDYFVCASPRQRDFWLGQLAGLGRLNHRTYDANTRFERLIGTVPFGVPDRPARASGPGARGVVPGIGPHDRLILWGGGIYNWFDPVTLIRAVDKLTERVDDVRLFFMGLRHPNPEVAEMRMSLEARRVARDLRLTDRIVFFNEGWVPYEERQNFLLDAHIGVSTHFDHIETEFSFRTRILDYIWAGLPIVATEGDWFADLIERERIGLTVPPENVAALEEALFRMLCDDDLAEVCRVNLGRLGSRFTWSEVLRPIVDFCRQPSRAPDLSDIDTRATLWAPDADRLADWERHRPTAAERLRRAFSDL